MLRVGRLSHGWSQLSALVTTLVLAAPADAFANLDLISAIAEVDAIHPLVISKREELRATESVLSAAKQQRLPSLSVLTSKPATTSANSIYTARVQQPLFAGGRIDAGIERSEAQIAEAQATLAATRRDLMVRTANAFIEVIKGKARLQIANRSVAEHERLLDSIGRRVSAEISPENDLMLTRSRLSQAATERSQVALALQRAEDVLAELLARKPPELIEPTLRPAPPFADLRAALDAGEVFSPEIKRASAQESIALSDVDIQKAAAMPSIFARYDQNMGELNPGYARSQTYFGVEYIPGAGLSVASQIQAAHSRRQAAIEARRVAEKDVRDRIRSLWAESSSLKRQLETAQNYVRSAQVVSDSFARQFTIGRKTWLEVLNAIRESALAELSLADILWSSRLTDLRLEIETGSFTIDSMRLAPGPATQAAPVRSAPPAALKQPPTSPGPDTAPTLAPEVVTPPAVKRSEPPAEVPTQPNSVPVVASDPPKEATPAPLAPQVITQPAIASPVRSTPQVLVQPTPTPMAPTRILVPPTTLTVPASKSLVQPIAPTAGSANIGSPR